MYEINKQNYYKTTEMIEILKSVGIKTCPVLETYKDVTIFSDSDPSAIFKSVNEIVEFSTRKSTMNKDVWQEGIVFVKDDSGMRLSFKVINPEFLIKFDA
jgi:hypothetical protein